jgi:hypothetical protein
MGQTVGFSIFWYMLFFLSVWLFERAEQIPE